MKRTKQQIFELAKRKYQTHLEIFNLDLLEESYLLYKEYKEQGGKKKIERLEEIYQNELLFKEDETRTQEEKNERNINFRKLHKLDNERYIFFDYIVGEIISSNYITSLIDNISDRINEYKSEYIIKYLKVETNENGEKLIFFNDVTKGE